MSTRQKRVLGLSLGLLVTCSALAHAQVTAPLRDPVQAVGREDSVKAGGILRGLLQRLRRGGADSAATAAGSDSVVADGTPVADPVTAAGAVLERRFKTRKDSLAWVGARSVAEAADEFRVVVDLFARQLYVIQKNDTLRAAPAATALNTTLTYGGRTWRFETPRGVRTVLGKEKDPVWRPPDWHFAEVALEHNLKLRSISRGQVIRLRDGTRLKIEGDEVGIIAPGEKTFMPLVLDDHIVFDNTLFVPPLDTKHRQVEGELGHYRLILGDGFLLHGTPYAGSIGANVTHGCVRLGDDDIEWLFNNVPMGTKVYIY
jgi:lipoprotein-anchoring transpeptidase ErfK/SrfK